MYDKKRLIAHTLYTLPVGVIYAVFFVFPLFLGIYYSFTDWNGIAREFHFIGFQNYADVLSDRRAMNAVKFTIRYALQFSILLTILSLSVAMLLNHSIPGRTLIRAIYFFPAVLSAIVTGLIFNEIYYRVVPEFGKALGIAWLSKSPASSPSTAIYAIMFANLWQSLAIQTAIMLAGLQSVPQELYEVASIDGASAPRRFFSITLPFIAPTLTIVLVLAVKDGLLLFDYVKAITEGGPGGSTHSIGTYIYMTAFENMRYSYSVANSVLLFILISLFGIMYIRLMGLLEAKS